LGDQRLALRQLLGRFVAVCNAVGYAHSRGGGHPGLKPANIMLGRYGETLVGGLGLARYVEGGAKGAKARAPSAEGKVQSTKRAKIDATSTAAAETPAPGPPRAARRAMRSEERTEPGQILGTPAYMSPEQAAGLAEAADPSSDVYSLGATLYTVL